MKELLEQLTTEIARKIEDQLEAGLQGMVAKAFKANLKVIFDETEAAAFLGISPDTLSSWRKRGLVEYAQYPASRIRNGEDDKLSSLYTYDLAGLLSFRARYIIKTVSPSKFDLVPQFSVVGPMVEEVDHKIRRTG